MNEITLKMLLALIVPDESLCRPVVIRTEKGEEEIWAYRGQGQDDETLEVFGTVDEALEILRLIGLDHKLRAHAHKHHFGPLTFQTQAIDYKALEEKIAKEFEKGNETDEA